MCTVSWAYTPDGYELLCNRDEKKTRSKADPPVERSTGNTTYIAPTDTDAGGTWIAVNEHGVTMCLLNGVAGARPYASSRGWLIPELIAARDRKHALAMLRAVTVDMYAPFTLAILSSQAPAIVVRWNGQGLSVDNDVACPLISSSFDLPNVDTARRHAFASAASLDDFHASHASGPSAYSPCMHRHDAETVSFSRIVVTAENIRFAYTPHSPCIPLSSSRSLHLLARTLPASQPAH